MNITSKSWFDSFIILNIVAISVATGVELEAGNAIPQSSIFSLISDITLASFTAEAVLKLLAEGFKPWYYFTDAENGNYNTFDFMIVIASFVMLFSGSSHGNIIGGLRVMRIIRLLTFVKRITQLRVIISGLFNVRLFAIIK